jgi:predicted nucleotidyltransferase
MTKQLIDFMFSPYRRQVLAVLFLHADEQFHVRQLERLTGISAGSLHRELRAMAGAGLLRRQHQGNQVLYQVNKACSIYDELASIFRKTVGLAFQIRDALIPISAQIDSAFVFGSMASGKQHAGSDLDICVLGDIELFDVVKALGPLQEQLRIESNPVVVRPAKFRDQLKAHDPFAQRVFDEQKLFVIGDENDFRKLVEDRPA